MILPLDYIAGLIDADGCFTISLASSRTGSSIFIPTFVVNFRQDSLYKEIVLGVQETLGVGKVYNHIDRMKTWQTTSWKDTLVACKQLEPHLKIKKESCQAMIRIIEEWWNPDNVDVQKRWEKKPIRPKWLVLKLLDTAVNLNKSRQSGTVRAKKANHVESLRSKIENSYLY